MDDNNDHDHDHDENNCHLSMNDYLCDGEEDDCESLIMSSPISSTSSAASVSSLDSYNEFDFDFTCNFDSSSCCNKRRIIRKRPLSSTSTSCASNTTNESNDNSNSQPKVVFIDYDNIGCYSKSSSSTWCADSCNTYISYNMRKILLLISTILVLSTSTCAICYICGCCVNFTSTAISVADSSSTSSSSSSSSFLQINEQQYKQVVDQIEADLQSRWNDNIQSIQSLATSTIAAIDLKSSIKSAASKKPINIIIRDLLQEEYKRHFPLFKIHAAHIRGAGGKVKQYTADTTTEKQSAVVNEVVALSPVIPVNYEASDLDISNHHQSLQRLRQPTTKKHHQKHNESLNGNQTLYHSPLKQVSPARLHNLLETNLFSNPKLQKIAEQIITNKNYNYNMSHNDTSSRHTPEYVLSERMSMDWLYNCSSTTSSSEHSFCIGENGRTVMLWPIYTSNKTTDDGSSSTAAAFLLSVVFNWDPILSSLIHDANSDNDAVIISSIVLRNSCGQSFTYLHDGDDDDDVMVGDHHDTRYDLYEHTIRIHHHNDDNDIIIMNNNDNNMATTTTGVVGCEYSVHIYPAAQQNDMGTITQESSSSQLNGQLLVNVLITLYFSWFIMTQVVRRLIDAATATTITTSADDYEYHDDSNTIDIINNIDIIESKTTNLDASDV